MSKLSAAQRKAIPKSDFAVPSKAGTPQGKAKGGSYPIPDESHARDALSRSSGKPVASEVQAKVKAKFPNISISKSVSNIRSKLSNHGKRSS